MKIPPSAETQARSRDGRGPLRLVPARCAPASSSRAKRRSRRPRGRRRPVAPFAPVTLQAARASLASAAGTGSGSRAPRWVTGLVLALSLALHGGFGIAVWRARAGTERAHVVTRVVARVHEAPPLPPPPPPVETAPSPRAPAPKLARAVLPRAPKAAPPPAAPVAPAPVRVVGLSLESTSENAAGPAFAVGDTLAGNTSAIAAQPHAPAADPAPVTTPAPSGPNRVARGVPRAGSVYTPPRRLEEVKPHYPDAKRAAGIEADVLLVVSLDEKGRIEKVTLGKSSGDPSFDEAARQAALKERFAPALRDGAAVPTTFSFTTHFRLDTP